MRRHRYADAERDPETRELAVVEPTSEPDRPAALHLASLIGNQAFASLVSPRTADMKTVDGGVEDEGMSEVDARVPSLQRQPVETAVGDPSTADPAAGDAGVPAAAMTATLPAHVRGAASPAAMADRIPPRVTTVAHVDISGLKPGDPPVELSVAGAGGGNGTVTIDGSATKSVSASSDVNLKGVDQTDSGKGGALRLVAKRGGSQLATSGGFSVSSIPQNYTDTFVRLVTGAKRGVVVQDGWESDSGVVADLNETEIAEQVEVTAATGCFAGLGKINSGYLPGDKFSQDTHSSAVAALTTPGNKVAQQTCMFKDKRAGSTDIPMTKSGYTIVRDVRAKDAGGLTFHITKNGAATTANGVTSGAGSGSIDKTQDV
jgi:hypothetical protein